MTRSTKTKSRRFIDLRAGRASRGVWSSGRLSASTNWFRQCGQVKLGAPQCFETVTGNEQIGQIATRMGSFMAHTVPEYDYLTSAASLAGRVEAGAVMATESGGRVRDKKPLSPLLLCRLAHNTGRAISFYEWKATHLSCLEFCHTADADEANVASHSGRSVTRGVSGS